MSEPDIQKKGDTAGQPRPSPRFMFSNVGLFFPLASFPIFYYYMEDVKSRSSTLDLTNHRFRSCFHALPVSQNVLRLSTPSALAHLGRELRKRRHLLRQLSILAKTRRRILALAR